MKISTQRTLIVQLSPSQQIYPQRREREEAEGEEWREEEGGCILSL